MTEERVSLLPKDAPERRWLGAEQVAARFHNWAALRLTSVLDPAEGDLLVKQVSSKVAFALAGRDPNVQFISLSDAARALVAAAESDATGVFNAGGSGALPFKKGLRAAGTRRVPLPQIALRHLLGKRSLDQLQYNWTVSSERSQRDLGFHPELSSVQALAEFLRLKPDAHADRLREAYDDWGLDLEYIHRWSWWFAFLRKIYWRIEFEGMDHIPPQGRAMLVSNHRGFMPLDAVMLLHLVLAERCRVTRFLIIHSLLCLPFLSNFLTKLGGVIATRKNAERLFAAENLVGIFPEGVRGGFAPYRSAYRLRDFSKSGFARIAIENQAPIVPVAVVGHAEIFRIIARVNWRYLRRKYGWPYLPIAPMFPLAPIPLPSKWHVRILAPVELWGLKPADAGNVELVREFSRYIQEIIQVNLDEMVARRKRIFWGQILDGSAPARTPFEPQRLKPLSRSA